MEQREWRIGDLVRWVVSERVMGREGEVGMRSDSLKVVGKRERVNKVKRKSEDRLEESEKV